MDAISRSQYRIVDLRPVGRGRIQLQYVNGPWVENDLSDLIAIGGIYNALADDSYLAKVRIGEYGRYIEWPDEIDIGADTLWEDGVLVELPAQPVASL
jgi:hypothetical protein